MQQGAADNDIDGMIPLLYASAYMSTAMIRVVLMEGALLEQIELYRSTSLQDSVCYNATHTFRSLAEGGAPLETRSSPGSAAMHIAVGAGQLDRAAFLVEVGADPYALARNGEHPM